MFGTYMRDQRERAGKGLRETARAIGINAGYLSSIERSDLYNLKPEKLVLWCEFLGVDVDGAFMLRNEIAPDLISFLLREPSRISMLRNDYLFSESGI